MNTVGINLLLLYIYYYRWCLVLFFLPLYLNIIFCSSHSFILYPLYFQFLFGFIIVIFVSFFFSLFCLRHCLFRQSCGHAIFFFSSLFTFILFLRSLKCTQSRNRKQRHSMTMQIYSNIDMYLIFYNIPAQDDSNTFCAPYRNLHAVLKFSWTYVVCVRNRFEFYVFIY